jgi:RNA polymerase sigma-B factor
MRDRPEGAGSATRLPLVSDQPRRSAMVYTERLAPPDCNGAAPAGFACSWTDGSEDAAYVHLTGELDLSTAPELERTLQRAQARAPVVVLDLRELTFIDSSGLHAIANANARAKRAGGRSIVVRGTRQFDRLMTVTGLCKLLEIVDLDSADPPAEAIRRLAGQTPLDKHAPATIMEAREFARQTDEELLDTHYREGDLAARDELVDRFMPYARKLAVHYIDSPEPMDDLVQVASIGLLNAIDRFDPDQGKKFTAFAAPTILGELKRHFRDGGWTIHVPRDLQERVLAVRRHVERLSGELRRSPTLDELAHALDCTLKQAVEAIDAGENYQLASLDAPVDQDHEDGSVLADMLGVEDDGFELADDRQALASSWAKLPQLERQVLGLRLVHGLTQREISRRIGYSQMHVSRLLRRSMRLVDATEVPAACA